MGDIQAFGMRRYRSVGVAAHISPTLIQAHLAMTAGMAGRGFQKIDANAAEESTKTGILGKSHELHNSNRVRCVSWRCFLGNVATLKLVTL